MAINAAHWTIDRDTKKIAYIGGDHNSSPSYATVIELHRWLQSLADDAYSIPASNDELDITNTDPSRRSTDNIITLINGYTLDETPGTPASEHLYDGSIIQSGGNDVWDGIVNFGNADVQIQIIQNGSIISDDWWNYAGFGLNANATAGISHRFMIKVKTSGTDIDGRRIIGISRRFNYTYGEFRINGTARGNNVLALSDATDLNNQTVVGTVAGWSTITNTEVGYNSMDADSNGSPEYYYSKWDKASYSINQFYERMKYLVRADSSISMYGINGEMFRGITHEITYSSLTGTFDEANAITWPTGTGQCLADNGTNKVWIQLLTGVAPIATDVISQASPDAASATVSSTTDRVATLSMPFIGVSTGSAIIGAYGVGITANQLTSSDKVTDLGTNVITPPNYVTNTVASIAPGVDYVLVAPWNGSSYDVNGDPAITKNQLSLSTALNSDNITSVVVTISIPADTPAAGTIRVADNQGYERRLPYTSWTGSTFTISSASGQEDFLSDASANIGNNVYITYIDASSATSSIAFTGVQTGSRQLVVIVRDGGVAPIKQFISSWSYSASNQTINAIRTTDV